MTWIAIRTEPGRLPVVRQLLRKQGETCYLPAEIRFNHRRRKRIVVPMMPYLFIKTPYEEELTSLWMHKVKGTRYVKGFVSVNALIGPHPIADSSIDLLRRSISDLQQVERARKTMRGLRKGKRAVIKNGPLAGRKGTVSWMNGNRAKLEALIFGSVRTVTVSLEQLEAA